MQDQTAISCECCKPESEEPQDHRKIKFLIVVGIVLTISTVILEMIPHHALTDYFILALATPVQFFLGKPFYQKFFNSLRQRRVFTTDALIVFSTSVAYIYSLVSLLSGSDAQFFEASVSVLTIFTIGEYMEDRVLQSTSGSIRSLLALRSKTATVIRNNKEETIDADHVIEGDVVVTRPGEKIAADGIIIDGESSVDESMITGESMPVSKKIGEKVIGGAINKNGYLKFKATGVGSHTVLASIIGMVEKAKTSKAPIQRITDRAVKYFVPIVFAIAITSSLYWLLIVHEPISFAITVFATVLVVSCPCALGIATPMVVSLGVDKAAREGVLIKGGEYLEKLSSIDTIVFDKTGTLTYGKPEVTDVIPNEGYDEKEILQISSSVEIRSEHPIAQAIVRRAAQQGIITLGVTSFSAISGQGVVARFQEKKIFVGSYQDKNILTTSLQSKISELESDGKTVIIVIIEDRLAGYIAVADTLRHNAKEVVSKLKGAGKKVILLTGDNERIANSIAKKLGITQVLSHVMPETKLSEVKNLQDKGKKVAMIGDGINDAPALTQADIGIAIGSGTDVAMASGHVILMKSDLGGVLSALNMGRYSLKKIKQNLVISFVYNAITITIATGLFYGLTNSLILTPTFAALGWIVSDTSVFGNSLLIRKFVPK